MDPNLDEKAKIAEKKYLEEVAKRLNKAVKSSNEKDITKEILALTNRQRQTVKSNYVEFYKQYLEEDLRNSVKGEFLECVLALLKERYEYESGFMNEAIASIGSDEKLIIQLLCTKDARSLKSLKQAYRDVFGRDFQDDITSQDGDNDNLYHALASDCRAENHGYDIEEVKKDAQELINASSKKGQLDEKVFTKILSTRSFPQLYSTFAIYSEMAKDDIEQVLKRVAKGNFLLTCLTMIKCVRNKPGYFAELINDCLSVIGTKDSNLIRLLVCRQEIDLPDIKIEYQRLFNKSLYESVKKETSGNYQKLLLGIIGQ